jgi:hypothetical protein
MISKINQYSQTLTFLNSFMAIYASNAAIPAVAKCSRPLGKPGASNASPAHFVTRKWTKSKPKT